MRKIKKIFVRVSRVLAAVNTAAMLAVLFFFIIVPMGVLFRTFGRPPLGPRAGAPGWQPRGPETTLDRPY